LILTIKSSRRTTIIRRGEIRSPPKLEEKEMGQNYEINYSYRNGVKYCIRLPIVDLKKGYF